MPHHRLFTLWFVLFLFLSFFRLPFFARVLSVIGIFLMTPRRTAAACLGFDEFQGQAPFAERDLVRDQFRVLAGMDHMADLASLAAVLPVDMKIMQVLVSVPEAGRKGCCGKSEQVAVMAAEAQRKFSIIVGHIELGRVWLDQEFVVRRTMRVVAGRARSVPYGAVEYGLGFFDEVLVAVEAERLAGLRQELRRIARVRRMTRHTAPLRLNGRVDVLCRFERIFDRGMALKAELGDRC